MLNIKMKTALSVALAMLLCGCGKADKVYTFGLDTGAGEVISAEDAAEDKAVPGGKDLASGKDAASDKDAASGKDATSGKGSSDSIDVPGSEKEPELLYVHVCGAVVNPGVVALPEGSRAEAALQSAGGFAENADESGVNLAAPVYDGEQLYFPYEGEKTSDPVKSGDGRVNINSADIGLLCSIPGIGEAKAEAIVNYRENNGRFENAEDIMNVSGIGQGVYDKISAHICVK